MMGPSCLKEMDMSDINWVPDKKGMPMCGGTKQCEFEPCSDCHEFYCIETAQTLCYPQMVKLVESVQRIEEANANNAAYRRGEMN